MKILVDTSIFLAVLLNEDKKADIIKITSGASLFISPTVKWEIGNAISAMFKRRRITLPEAKRIIEQFLMIPVSEVNISLDEAIELSSKYKIYAYDAYIIAAAIDAKLPLLSLDKNMIEICKQEKIRYFEV